MAAALESTWKTRTRSCRSSLINKVQLLQLMEMPVDTQCPTCFKALVSWSTASLPHLSRSTSFANFGQQSQLVVTAISLQLLLRAPGFEADYGTAWWQFRSILSQGSCDSHHL